MFLIFSSSTFLKSGNTRVQFSDLDGDGQISLNAQDGEVMQVLAYYPSQLRTSVGRQAFGMTIEGLNPADLSDPENRYRYNGKEEEPNSRMYDYGARWYMADIGRWGVVDPLAEKYSKISPFVYVANNPLSFIDPDGMRIVPYDEKAEELYNQISSYVNSQVEAYDNRTQRLRNKGRNKWADRREARRGKNEFVQIQTELTALDEDEMVFMLRTGDNITSTTGGGNIMHNPSTGEIDLNISGKGDFSDIQQMAHELKHAHQFLTGDLGFQSHGAFITELYDKTDEIAAFERQNLFADFSGGGKINNVQDFVANHKDYRGLPNTQRYFSNLPQDIQTDLRTRQRFGHAIFRE